jgi:hypothetical protein
LRRSSFAVTQPKGGAPATIARRAALGLGAVAENKFLKESNSFRSTRNSTQIAEDDTMSFSDAIRI